MFTKTAIDVTGRVMQVTQSQFESLVGVREDAQLILSEPPPFADSYWDFGTYAWARMGEQPSPNHEWVWATKQWVDPRTLADLQAARWQAIKTARADAIDAPLITPYGTFDSDAKARTAITDSVLMLQTLAALGTPQTIDFTLADNEVVTLDTAQMVTVGLMLGQKVQTAHARARVLRADIEAATTPEQVDAVVW